LPGAAPGAAALAAGSKLQRCSKERRDSAARTGTGSRTILEPTTRPVGSTRTAAYIAAGRTSSGKAGFGGAAAGSSTSRPNGLSVGSFEIETTGGSTSRRGGGNIGTGGGGTAGGRGAAAGGEAGGGRGARGWGGCAWASGPAGAGGGVGAVWASSANVPAAAASAAARTTLRACLITVAEV